jgi:hypothetical protein
MVRVEINHKPFLKLKPIKPAPIRGQSVSGKYLENENKHFNYPLIFLGQNKTTASRGQKKVKTYIHSFLHHLLHCVKVVGQSYI